MKFSVTFILFLFLNRNYIVAQQSDSTSNKHGFGIKINPLQLTVGEVRVLWEIPIKNHNDIVHSIEITSSYMFDHFRYWDYYNSISTYPTYPTLTNGIKLGIGYRRYRYGDEYYFNPLFFYKIQSYLYTKIYFYYPILFPNSFHQLRKQF